MRQLTIRLPRELLEESKRLATKRRTSVNQLVRSLLEDVARLERERALGDAYAQLGSERLESDVALYEEAQAEVAERD